MKRILLLIALSFISFVGFSQTKGISYQAVIIDPNPIEIPGKDVTAQPYVSKDVWIRFGIYSGTTLQYEELHKTKTDEYGLVNLIIGAGVNTGKAGTFTSLSWDGVTKNIITNVSFDQGGRYTEVSNQKLTYVPYSLLSETAVKLAGVLPVSQGGTGATNAIAARTNLGLGNVDNTADVDKPVSIATLAILDTKEAISNKSTNIIADSASSVKYPSVKAIKDYIDSRNSASANSARLAAKATALETPRTINGVPFDGTANITIPVGVTPPDADATTKGLVQLAGDLSGTAASPTIAAGSVNTAKIADGAVTTGKLAAGAVTTAKVADGAITDAKITSVAGSKVTGNIAGNAGTATKLAAPKNINGVPFDGSSDITISASASTLSGTIAIANGGTGASTAAGARTNLGLVIGTDVLAQRTFGTAANSAATDFVAATEKGANNGVATLGVNGKIPSTQIPAISFQNVNVVNSDASMTAIVGAQVGSIAIRTDNNNNYVLSALPASTLSNWIALATPLYVSTVNGYAGPNVSLTTNDVPEGSTNKYYTDARVRNAISATGPLNFNASTGVLSMTTASTTSGGFLTASDYTNFNNKQTALTAGVDYATPSGNITGNAANVTGIVSIANGGTGTSTASGALLTLGAEPSANKSNDILVDGNSTTKFPTFKAIKDYVDQQSANAGVADNSITSAKINGTLAVLKGGTGASTPAGARTNLGLVIGTDVMAANFTTTLTGDVTGSGNGSFATTLANSGVISGTYGSSTAIPTLTVDSKGRITSAGTVGIIAGVNSLNYTSTTSYATGGTISGTSLTLAAADGTNPGLISTGAQTIAGAKTFSNDVTAPNFIGNASTATTAGNITATSNTTITSLANLNSVGTITSGTWSATEIAIAKGGTGATTAAGARANLGLGSLATKSSIANADVASGAAIDFTKLNIIKADITGLGIQEGLTAGSGISIASGTISVTGLTAANLSPSAGITNAQLANSSTTLGSTTMTLGGTVTSVTGLTSLAATNLTGTLSGTATSLATGRTIALTGDVTYTSPAFDGSGNVTAAATLANSGVASGTYGSSTAIPVLTVDTKGRVTSASTVGIIAGVNSLNYTSTTSYTAGGTISGTALTLTAADATNPGLISIGAQTIAGAKSFSNDVTAPNFIGNVTGTVTGNLSGTAYTATNLAGGVSGSIPYQTAAGVTGMIPTGQANQILTATGSGTYTWTSVSNVTGNSVPYTGATGAVNLGPYDLTVNGLTVGTGVNGSTLSNTAFGVGALAGNNSGTGKNTAIGYSALNKNTTGMWNTAIGYNALLNQVTNLGNTAIGTQALEKNIANGNTAVGNGAGYWLDNSLFYYNTFLGYGAGGKARGQYNIGIGNLALEMRNSGTNTGADRNIAIGNNTLYLASKPIANVVIGDNAGAAITLGSWNTILGQQSGENLTQAYHNTILGDSTGLGITTGSNNTILGSRVSGLSPTLTGNIILSDGSGNIRAQHDGSGWSLGTITSGTWSGTVIGSNYGGAGTINGLLKANGSGVVSAAISGTDFQAPLTAGSGISIASGTISATGLTTSNLASNAAITNGQLANSSTTLGSTTMTLGGTVTSVTGLTSLSSTTLVGTLSGTATTASNIAGGVSGSIPYQTAAGTTDMIPTGSANQFLTSTGSGTYTWTSSSSVTGNFVPYSGATGAVNLGSYDLTVNGLRVGRGNSNVASNTAIGTNSLNTITTGANNVSVGYAASNYNQTGSNNTALGAYSMNSNATSNAWDNTAIGFQTLAQNTTGGYNTVVGSEAGYRFYGAAHNVAVGYRALTNNNSGNYNVAIGDVAGPSSPTYTSSNSIFIGASATPKGTSAASNETVIGYNVSGNGSNTVTIGNSSVTDNYFKGNINLTGNVVGGTWSGTTIALANGGTGATTASDARTNLGLGSLATKSTIANADVASGAAIDFAKLNITKADITGLGIQDGLTAGSGISLSSGTISVTGLTTSNLASNAAITNGQLANSSTILGSTTMTLGGTVTSVTGLVSVSSTGFTGTLTGNASTATKLAATKNINGVAFDGSADITVTADAGTLSGTTLNSTVTSSSLTGVGTITTGTWSGTAIAIANGGTGATTKTAAFNALSPMTTSGDLIYGGTLGTGTRLPIGTDGQVLTLASGLPSWATPSGISTLTAIGATPNANGGTISGTTFNLQPANASFGGVVTTGSQTFAGAKTFSPSVSAATNLARGTIFSPTLTAAANSDVLVGVDIAPTFTNGSFSSLSNYALRVTGTSYFSNSINVNSTLFGAGTKAGNVAIGNSLTLSSNVNGLENIAIGSNALTYINPASQTNTYNIGIGYYSLGGTSNTGTNNIALGIWAMSGSGLTGNNNVAIGYNAIKNLTSGTWNNAIGKDAMGGTGPVTGSENNAFGFNTLNNITSGSSNSAFGGRAMNANTTGYNNSALGSYSLYLNTAAVNNTALGTYALYAINGTSANTGGSFNIGLGHQAGRYVGNDNSVSNTTGRGLLLLGYDTRPLADGDINEVVISGFAGTNGNFGATGLGTNTTLIGNSSTTLTQLMGALNLPNTTTSTSTTTGALRVGGGAGIVENLNVGGATTLIGAATISNTTASNSTTSGALVVRGGVGMAGNLTVGGTIEIDGGSPAAGKVLSSDANGVGSWTYAVGSTVVTSTSSYAITLSEAYVFYTGTSTGAFTIPAAAAGNAGKTIVIKNKTAFGITVTPASGTIYIDNANASAANVSIGIEASNNWIKLVSDGTQWNVIRALF